MAPPLVIDADTHLTEPPDVWTSRVPKRFLDDVPHMVRTNGRDIWMLGDKLVSVVGLTATAGWPKPIPDGPPTLDDCHPAAHDAAARLKYMDEVGVWAQVLYPNVAGFGNQHFLHIDDDQLKMACVRAYNDFLIEWAAEADARRFVAVMATPFWDVEAAVGEVQRCAQLGHRGVLFTGEPQRFGLPYLGDHHWDPLWSAAQEAGLPVHFHIGSGDMSSSFTGSRMKATGTAATYAYTSVEMFLKNGLQVSDLLVSGVLPRFPDLKFVSVESGIGWIPFVLEAADYSYLEGRPDRVSEWELLPSEYFARQVYACYWFESVAPRALLGEIPVDNILFETDFPHPTCLYGDVRGRIDASLAGASDEARQKILWDNAATLYGIEAP